MKKLSNRVIDLAFVFLLFLLLVVPQDVFAQNHVVSSAELQRDVAAASVVRQRNIAQIDDLIALPQARQALQSAHIDYRQVTDAVSQLTAKDLAQLSLTSARAQRQFAAGQMSNHDLLLLIVAVAVLILIIVAVKH
ncbi:MAG: hypothetical protein WBQ34_05315 [Candidatus Acidiferrales bacterium]